MNNKKIIGSAIILIIAAAIFGFTKMCALKQNPADVLVNQEESENSDETDTDQAREVIRSLLTAEHAVNNPEITIVKATENHIRAEVFFNPGGGYILAVKVGGDWQKATEGNGIPLCADILKFNFPKDMVSSCLTGDSLVLITDWDSAKSAVSNCMVEAVMQSHSREVTLDLKDGRRLLTMEPQIDDIIDLAVAAEESCGEIIMATE